MNFRAKVLIIYEIAKKKSEKTHKLFPHLLIAASSSPKGEGVVTSVTCGFPYHFLCCHFYCLLPHF